jgi:hypothetical protein
MRRSPGVSAAGGVGVFQVLLEFQVTVALEADPVLKVSGCGVAWAAPVTKLFQLICGMTPALSLLPIWLLAPVPPPPPKSIPMDCALAKDAGTNPAAAKSARRFFDM